MTELADQLRMRKEMQALSQEVSPTVMGGIHEYLRGVSDAELARCLDPKRVPPGTVWAAELEDARRRVPRRIQRKRSSGWKMPVGAVYVGRPGPYGNPYQAATYAPAGVKVTRDHTEHAVLAFRCYVLERLHKEPDWLEPLRGKHLACWCREGEPCHADVLLEFANRLSNEDLLTQAAGAEPGSDAHYESIMEVCSRGLAEPEVGHTACDYLPELHDNLIRLGHAQHHKKDHPESSRPEGPHH